MFASLNTMIMTYTKTEKFEERLQELSRFAKVFSHPARLAILKYLTKKTSCFSGDITSEIPLSRTTVSQHLQELKKAGLIQGTIEGIKVNYCICDKTYNKCKKMFAEYFNETTNDIEYEC